MRIVIVGMGKIGFSLAEALSREKHEVTVIDREGATLTRALEKLDVAGTAGSAVDSAALREANADKAELVIAVTGSDEINLLCCLLSKKLGAQNTIARIRGPEYSDELHLIKNDLGLSMAVNPEREMALEIARILGFPLARNVESFARGRVELASLELPAGSPLIGKSIQSLFSHMRARALVCAVERGDEVYIPSGAFVFEAGDVATFVAPAGRTAEFLREAGVKLTGVRDVILVGGGRASFYLARQLCEQKMRVTLIERDPRVAENLSRLLPNVTVIAGDGTNHALLAEEGLATADAICCLTGIDEENILTSMYAATLSDAIKTVTKINRDELEHIARRFGIGSVVSPQKVAANLILRYVRAKGDVSGGEMLTLYRLLDGRAEAIEFLVRGDSKLLGTPLEKLPLRDHLLVACINRKGRAISPRGGDRFEAGDSVIIVTRDAGLTHLDDIVRRA